MADELWPNLHLRPLNFDWLGELPAINEARRVSDAQRAVFADLPDKITPDELEKRAYRLFQAGDEKGGLGLLTQASTRRGIDQRGANDAMTVEYLKALSGRGGLTGGMPKPEGYIPSPTAPAEAPASPFDRPAGALPGPQSEAPPSPSDQLIQRAQMGAPTPGPQLAGPLPTPDSSPQSLPPWLKGAQMPAEPAAPPVASPPQAVPGKDPRQQALDEVNYWTEQAARVPRGVPGAASAIRQRLQDAVSRAAPKQNEADFIEENYRRAISGERLLRSPTEFELMKKTQFPEYESAAKLVGEITDKSRAAEEQHSTIQAFKQVLNSGKFESGPGTEDFNNLKGTIRNLKDVAVTNGWLSKDNPIAQQVDTVTDGVRLREFAKALSSQMTTSAMGGLGAGKSDSDRIYQAFQVPGVGTSVEGNKILNDYLEAKNTNAKAIGEMVDKYKAENQHNIKDTTIRNMVRAYEKSHGIIYDAKGELTSLGKRLNSEEARARRDRGSDRVSPGERVKGPKGLGVIGPDGSVVYDNDSAL